MFFGGAKGGSKSEALLLKSLRQVDLPRYKGLILRQTFQEVQELIDRSHRLFPGLEGRPSWNGSLRRWTFPNQETGSAAGGQVIQFGHCKSVDEVKNYHGGEWAYIGFDEVADVKDPNVWVELLAENRCPNPAVRVQACASGNPGRPGHPWCKRRFIDKCGKRGERIYTYDFEVPGHGTVLRTRRFIPSKVTDNPVYANDPVYLANLHALPEMLRNQLLYGDWDSGYGMALDELDEFVHIVPRFDVPDTWTQFAAFDWGYAHPWVLGHYCVDEDGTIFKIDTIHGRHMSDRRIAERINDKVDVTQLKWVASGHDCWAEHKARVDNVTESTAERFLKASPAIVLSKANIGRPAGLRNFREQIAWRSLLPPEIAGGEPMDADPNFFWMDTPGNRRSFENCSGMVTDPDDMEDALELNADPMSGEGGDDDYDETRYGLASRPPRAMPTWQEEEVRAWSKAVLVHEQELGRRHVSVNVRRTPRGHHDAGGY